MIPRLLLVLFTLFAYSVNSYANNYYYEFTAEITQPSISVSYNADKNMIEDNDNLSVGVKSFLQERLKSSISEANETISEYCEKTGEYSIHYDFFYATRDFVSMKESISYQSCFAGAEEIIEYLNVFNNNGEIILIDAAPLVYSELHFNWNDVDPECQYIEHEVEYSLFFDKQGDFKINLRKGPICEMSLKIEKKQTNLLFNKL